jgi:hypothetical protein
MAGIDDRARGLNERLADMDDEDDVDQADEDDQEDEGADDDAEQDDDEDQGDGEEAPARPAAAEGAPAFSAGLILAGISYLVFLQLVRGGTAQLKGWAAAKFINKPWAPAQSSG